MYNKKWTFEETIALVILFIFTIFIIFLFTFDTLGQKHEHPFECVADAGELTLHPWGYTTLSYPINDEVWEDMLLIPGESIWVGYENGGWNGAVDAHGVWKIKGVDTNDNGILVWIWQSPTTFKYEIFTFANTEVFADENGQHFGIHPCGGWSVERNTLNKLLIEILLSGEAQ